MAAINQSDLLSDRWTLSGANMSKNEVVLKLSGAEALVLFEWLARSENGGLLETECSAEQKLLWKMEGLLEKQVRVFAPDYKQMLGAAREEVDLSS